MNSLSIRILCICLLWVFSAKAQIQKHQNALQCSEIPRNWDEAMPLGNSYMGALIWQKNDKLRNIVFNP